MKMKFDKDRFQIAILLISALSVIATMLSSIWGFEAIYEKNEIILYLATVIVTILFTSYLLLIIRRINPKQYIYISYAGQDKELALSISQILSEQFAKLSKYRFEIRTADTIPFGDDIYLTMQKYVKESDVIIVVVSEDYIESNWCCNEFMSIANMNKRIIPIVINSYDYLSKLPVNISHIKSLSLRNCVSDKDFENQLLRLAKDLVRQRKD